MTALRTFTIFVTPTSLIEFLDGDEKVGGGAG
jgi:hypothetical protein